MLGREIRDPHQVESPSERAAGLGLLEHVTVFEPEKQTCLVRARVTANRGPFATINGAEITGYEIHAGQTPGGVADALLRITTRSGHAVDDPDGAVSADGLVLGTYLHGLFTTKTGHWASCMTRSARLPSIRS